jgi:alanine transaminase
MQKIVKWCRDKGVCLMADEVYQDNIYKAGSKFVSFRKVAMDLRMFDGDENEKLQMISFHSTSKGFTGECGLRGGYMEYLGFNEDTKAVLVKLCSINLCSTTIGQIAMGLMVNPPRPGDESYDTYTAEKNEIMESLKRRASRLTDALNKLEGVTCNAIDGAMYAFPNIRLPPNAIEEAKKKGVAPDALYCMELLEATGIVVVPGSGFEQYPGTYHFRITILPPEDMIDSVIQRLSVFHREFMTKYA